MNKRQKKKLLTKANNNFHSLTTRQKFAVMKHVKEIIRKAYMLRKARAKQDPMVAELVEIIGKINSNNDE